MTNTCKYDNYVEKWAVFEASMPGKSSGNPFVDYNIRAVFQGKEETKTVDGFYDGDGIYRVRFMPSFEGEYTFTVKGSFSEEEFTGSFTAVSPSGKNHGPMRVSHTYHFAYEDGTPYYPVGTTCYVWELQSEELQAKTLKTLAENAFNKIRFCVFPKHYDYNLKEPRSYPYAVSYTHLDVYKRQPQGHSDFRGDWVIREKALRLGYLKKSHGRCRREGGSPHTLCCAGCPDGGRHEGDCGQGGGLFHDSQFH